MARGSFESAVTGESPSPRSLEQGSTPTIGDSNILSNSVTEEWTCGGASGISQDSPGIDARGVSGAGRANADEHQEWPP